MTFPRLRHLPINYTALGSAVGAATVLLWLGKTTAEDWRLYLAVWAMQVVVLSWWWPDNTNEELDEDT